MTPVPGIPDRDVAPAAIPCDLENAQAVLTVKTHFVVGQVNILFVFGSPIFQECVGL